MFGSKLHWYPVFLVLYLPVSFIITYTIAVGYGHVEAGFPYISDTGTLPPESCVFGQLLNIGAVFAAFTMYVRYRQIYEHCKDNTEVRRVVTVNKVAFGLGLVTALGVSLVGNFQETNILVVHLFGAFLAFGIGGIYCYIQTWISYKLPDMPGTSKFSRTTRLILCIADISLIITLVVASNLASKHAPPDHENRMKWGPSDPGYAEHLVSTIAEWLMAIVTVAYFLTFTKEFTKFRLNAPELIFHGDLKEQNNNPSTLATVSSAVTTT